MEIPEEINILNKRLKDFFGRFENGESNWRIVWSDDQLEKQLTEFTAEGFELPYKTLREVKKYPWIQGKYVLERLVPVPASNAGDLTTKLSYEPIWVFEDNNGFPLPPIWDACKLLIETLLDQTLYKKGPYKIAEGEGNTTEEIEARVEKLEKILYGNETEIGDRLARGEAVGSGTYRRNDSRFNNNPIKID
jgi:hypothetical protein